MKKNYTVLLVDDDTQICNVVKRILSSSGFIDVISTDKIKKASDILENIDIHLLIVDYNLPDGNGIELVQEIRNKEIGKYLPIVMLSGENIKVSALQMGVNMFLSKPFDSKELLAIVNNLLDLLDAYESLEQANSIIDALTKAVESRDMYTLGHSRRVADYSLMLYDEIGFIDFEERANLEIGCLLHDIGKIGTPDSILKSNKKLTKEERREIEKHPIVGCEICKELKNLKQAIPIIKSHHEKIDGSGYPEGLVGEEIPNVVQIVTIADIYDALTSRRAYRTENSDEEAFKIMDLMKQDNKLNSYFYEMFKKIIKNKKA